MKFFFKNKKGMTYVELLVAFTLLVLIIFVFSPMVLSSYEWLYKAGAMNESTYEAKSVLERDLASRFSENIQQFNITFKKQGGNMIENIAVNGRKIVAETESKLETLFFGGRARLTIVSSKIVPDDTSSHQIIVKTANIPWENSTDIVCQSKEVPTTAADMPEGKVYINAYAPTFSGTLEADMYSNYDSELITPITAVPSAKLIRLQVNGVDFTNSPIKIVATFKDEKGKLKSAEDFLYIEVPTLIMAGKAGEADYYTTAGLIRDDNGAIEYTKTVKDENGVNTDVKLKYSFALESRTMQIDNSLYSGLKTVRGTDSTINDIQYYNEEIDYANGLKPYYVLVGSNGGIFRTYGYTKASGYNMDYTLSFNGVTGTNVDATDLIGATHESTVYRITNKKPFSIKSTGSTVYPQFWSGDFTHHFGYATYDEGNNNYASSYSQGAWYTENTSNKGHGNLSFASQARYSMYFDGLNMSSVLMRRQKLRKMSYCLIDFDNDYLYKSCKYKGLGLKTRTETMKASALRLENSIKDSLYSGFFANWEKRAAICKEDTNTNSSQNKAMSVKTNDNDTTVKFSFIGIKEFSSVSGEKSEFYLDRANDSMNTGRIDDASAADVMLTASYYDPSLGNVVYLGTVHAYASVYQADNLGTASLKYNDGKDHIWVDDTDTPSFAENYKDRPSSWPTFYLIKANGNNDGAFIYKVNSSAQDEDKTWAKFTKSGDPVNNSKNPGNGSTDYHKLTPAQDMSKISSNIGTANSTAAHNFFGKRDSVDNVKGIYINDLQFTFGFSSYWESLYGSLVYSGTTENYRSYEAEYYESYYGDSVWNDNQGFPVSNSNDEKKPEESLVHAVPHSTKGDVSQFNKVTNDYYNVWFPGEMYNLTQADTKDGITVAVGYAVGASCYQFVNPSDYCSLSTAMGGVFNDGVLAVKKSDATSFDTKLYYKENSTFDATSLTSQTNYGANSGNNTTLCGANIAKSGSATNDNKNYGTHARNSVRFTAVALGSETIEGSNKEDTVINYYAYYGDNYGRVWKSLVATRSGGNNTNVVKNIKYGQGANTSAVGGINGEMTEVKYGGKSFSNYFTAIETITINNDGTMVITGAPATANNYIYTKYSYTVEGTGSTEDTVVDGEAMVNISGYSGYKIQDCVFVNEVLYCVGTVKDTSGNDASGFVFAMPATEIAKNNFKPQVINVNDPLYAVAGRVVA